MEEKTFDKCYWFHYDSYQDIRLYEVGTFRCPPSYGYGPIIRDTHIMHYIIKGRGKLIYHGKEYSIAANSIFMIWAGDVSYYEADATEPWEYIWIRFHGPVSDMLLQKAGISSDSPVLATGKNSEIVEALFQHILRNYKKEYDSIGTVYQIFQALIESSCPEPSLPPKVKTSEYILQVLSYIHQRYAEPISIQEISDYCGLDRSYLSRIFQSALGQSPQKYLRGYRMQKAKQQLTESSLSIQEVAFSVGYNDPFAFSKAFKHFTGMSPLMYRNTYAHTADDSE